MRFTTAIVLVVVVLAALYAVWIFVVTPPKPTPDPIIANCAAVLPQNARLGTKVAIDKDNNATLDFGGESAQSVGASPEAIAAFIACIEKAIKGKVLVKDGVRLPLEPIGQVADRWKAGEGVKLRLSSGGNSEVLQNLRIGPAIGLSREDVIREWCMQNQQAGCIRCDPSAVPDGIPEVLIGLMPNAPVKKIAMDGDPWPKNVTDPQTGKPVNDFKSFELIDENGVRYYYECAKP